MWHYNNCPADAEGRMISVIHPAARPERLGEIVRTWVSRTEPLNAIEYIVACHGFQADVFVAAQADLRRVYALRPLLLLNEGPNHPTLNGRSSYVDNVNLAAQYANGDIIVLATDDLEPPQGWDWLIREAIPDHLKEVVLRCSNGNAQSDARRLILHPIMTRARYERQGWFVCPEYTGVFSDNDLTERAYMDGVVVEAPYIVFQHHHPIFDSSVAVDDMYRAGNSPEEYARGAEVFARRKQQGFPLGVAVTA